MKLQIQMILVIYLTTWWSMAFSQIHERATPYTFTYEQQSAIARKSNSIFKPNHIHFNKINNKEELKKAEDLKKKCNSCRKDYYGSGINASIDIKKEGKLHILDDKSKLWLLTISSKDAYGFHFLFSKYQVPNGAKLHFYNEDKSFLLGAFTDINNREHKRFLTQTIPGDSITIEYYQPDGVEFDGELKIYKVVHIFKDVFYSRDGGFNASKSCNEDISSSMHQEEQRAICRISRYDASTNQMFYCSGALINNEYNYETIPRPFVLTAEHCAVDYYGNEEDHLNTVFDFNYQNPLGGIEPERQSVTSATLLSKGNESDYALYGLDVRPENFYHVSYLGWDRSSTAYPSQTECIHHPVGDIKKVARDFEPPVSKLRMQPSIQVINGEEREVWTEVSGTPTHWEISWNMGITEAGSSGAPLLNQFGHIVGQLSNGSSDCNYQNLYSDNFGLFHYSWDHYDNGWNPLRVYLGNKTTMGGYFPPAPNYDSDPDNPCTATIRNHGDSKGIRLTTTDRYNWEFGHNVDISGENIIVGSKLGGARIVNIYRRTQCGVEFVKKLVGPSSSHYLGYDVGISKNFAIVSETNDWGYVNIYMYVNNDWTLLTQIDGQGRFGTAVDITDDYAIIGNPGGDNSYGTVYFYERQADNTWSLVSHHIGNQIGAYFGNSVALYGDYAIVGAPTNFGTTNTGSFTIFKRINGTWTPQFTKYGITGSKLGTSVDITDKFAIAGDDDERISYIFARDGSTWIPSAEIANPDGYFQSVSISGNYAVLGSDRSSPNSMGSTQLYHFNGSNWSHAYKFVPTEGIGSDKFGTAVSIDGDYVLIGATEQSCHYAGAAYVYNISDVLYSDDKNICNYTPGTGNHGTISARNISLGGNCSVNINSGVTISYKATNEVILKDGFTAQAGSNFTASTYNSCPAFNNPSGAIQGRLANTSKVNVITYETDKNSLPSQLIEQYSQEELYIEVVPNPTSGLVKVNSYSDKINDVVVYNELGIRLYNFNIQRLSDNITEIDISRLPKGIYILFFNTQKGAIQKKIIRN